MTIPCLRAQLKYSTAAAADEHAEGMERQLNGCCGEQRPLWDSEDRFIMETVLTYESSC